MTFLSVVATSRNDDHGGDLLSRMQRFVDGFIIQCKRHALEAELILVEWNPPADKKSLSEALNFPIDKGSCTIRIVTVPPELHATLSHADKLPLFQMIAKNVGIRRAKGQYVLATNIDILFSDAVIQFIKEKLTSNVLYRVDRVDVPDHIEVFEAFEKTLTLCDQMKFRINNKVGTLNKIAGRWTYHFRKDKKNFKLYAANFLDQLNIFIKKARYSKKNFSSFYRGSIIAIRKVKKVTRIMSKGGILAIKVMIKKISFFKKLHTNGCGDFTLLSKKNWFRLRGYPEWPIFSWHIDSVLLYQAYFSGIKEKDLPSFMPVYHIEHSIGSGYTPEGVKQLFDRLDAKQLPYIDWPQFTCLIEEMKSKKKGSILYNPPEWGFAQHALPEVEF